VCDTILKLNPSELTEHVNNNPSQSLPPEKGTRDSKDGKAASKFKVEKSKKKEGSRGKLILFYRVRRLMGFKFTSSFFHELSDSMKLDDDAPFDDIDLDEIGEKVKHLNTVQRAEGFTLMYKGYVRKRTHPTVALRSLQLAISKLQEALDSNSNSKILLRNCAQAMTQLYQSLVSSSGSPDQSMIEQANKYYLRAIEGDPKDSKSLRQYAIFLDNPRSIF